MGDILTVIVIALIAVGVIAACVYMFKHKTISSCHGDCDGNCNGDCRNCHSYKKEDKPKK